MEYCIFKPNKNSLQVATSTGNQIELSTISTNAIRLYLDATYLVECKI